MVKVSVENDHFVFEILGIHKLWSFKSQITIPTKHVIKAYANKDHTNSFLGIRMPGINVPGILTAGSFMVDEGTIFCDFSNQNNLIIVELQDEKYKKLVIEVSDVTETLRLFPSS